MTEEILKRWQAHIWIGDETDEMVTVYGESLEQLRSMVKHWFVEHKPQTFCNTPPNYEIIRRIKRYFYVNDEQSVVIDSYGSREALAEGWYYSEGISYFQRPNPLPNFEEVVNHFVEHALITEAGPDYKVEQPEDSKMTTNLVPAIYGAVVGATSSICYLFLPTSGANTNTMLLEENLIFSLVTVVSMTGGFALLGWALGMRNSN